MVRSLLLTLCAWAGLSASAGSLGAGQAIDFALGVTGLNNTGGSLLFNHPGGLASDGTALVMSDRMNNRVLVWKTAPTANTAPDVVIGQPDMYQSLAGATSGQMNFPGQVAIGGGKLVVADSGNDRVLVWNNLPTRNGQAADLVLTLTSNSSAARIEWPWGVWTDGQRLIVSSTQGASSVNVWNTFPTAANTPPSYTLTGKNPATGSADFGTPRNIATDGATYLIIGDHNAKNVGGSGIGAFVWNTFPTSNQAYSYYGVYDTCSGSVCGQFPGNSALAADGRLFLMASPNINVYSAVPNSASALLTPSFQLGSGTLGSVGFNGMDGSALVILPDGRLYGASYNGNAILGWRRLPSGASAPAFVIGAPDMSTNTLASNGFIQNAVPASDGTKLVVGSGYDAKVYVWNSIPDRNGVPHDYTIDLKQRSLFSDDNDLYNGQFVTVGGTSVAIWKTLPAQDALPDLHFPKSIGSVTFNALSGVALDSRYLYLADSGAGKVYVFDPIPSESSAPRFTLDVVSAGRLSSDGTYLAVPSGTPGGSVTFFEIAKFGTSAAKLGEISGAKAVATSGNLRLWPNHAYLKDGKFYLTDAQNNFVYVWNSVASALADSTPDVSLGKIATHGATSETGFMMPAHLLITKNHLWVADFKFSTRLNAVRLDGCARPYYSPGGTVVIPDGAIADKHYRATLQYDATAQQFALGSVIAVSTGCVGLATYDDASGKLILKSVEYGSARYDAVLSGRGPFTLESATAAQ